MSKNRVVITGMGVVSPIGTGVENFREALYSGHCGIRHIPELEELGFECQVGGIPDISNSPFLDYLKDFNIGNASGLLIYAVLAGLEAWQNAGFSIGNNELTDYETGCMIGSGIGPVDLVSTKLFPNTNKEKKRRLRSTIVEQSMLNAPSTHLSMILGLGNQVGFNSSACATGTESIIIAANRIANGEATRMLAGGTESYTPHGWIGFDVLRVLNRKKNNNPQEASCPLSENAAGFVPGAGCGIVMLESLESARKRNATILAEIKGSHINSGGMKNGGSMTAPGSEAVIKCIQSCLQDAGLKPDDIDYINGHLSSTMADVLEIKNLSKALGLKGKDFPFINSLKAQTGHCIGAGGALETIAAVIQLSDQKIAPSVNSKKLHPEIEKLIDKSRIPDKPIHSEINFILKNSFGFGDVNTCLAIAKV